ncbi:MAG: imidazole glycerol phosphate synthase subunit HisH [Ignavibacteriales bacterium]|nr:imidazole glycerol phosphate synthase subunit HisH [Ignavibacteriales bacterium]
MIGIIDYHLNNLRSVQKAFEKVGFPSFISDNPNELMKAEKLVLPGVGAFGTAMENLNVLGLKDVLDDHVSSGKPLLGICLGMQLLFTKSYELGEYAGLNFINGEVKQFPSTVKVPHMGWNQVEIVNQSPLLKDVEEKSFVYFVHSYFVEPRENVTLTQTEYGFRFASIVEQGNIYGIQFHPEKSQKTGLQLLRNFAGI